MLGKLIKHEFKSRRGLYLGIYIIVILSSLLTMGAAFLHQRFPENLFVTSLNAMLAVTLVLSIIVMFAITLIMSVLRYYENLAKDEGYLMHTLPVSPLSLHVTKLIVPLCWFLADGLVLLFSILLTTGDWDFSWFRHFLETTGISNADAVKGFLIIGIYIILAILSALSMFYVAINIGSLSNTNKGVMPFVAYIVIYLIGQICSAVVLLVYMFILFRNESSVMAAINSGVVPKNYIVGVVISATILSVILMLIYNIISVYILSKKVNLE